MSVPIHDLPRDAPREGGRYEFGPFRLDPAERLLARGGRPVALTPKAFDLLVYLVERAGRLVEKRELMAALWPDTVVEEANLAYTVSALRKALGDGQEGEQFIQTVPTRGYRFVAPVVEQSPNHPTAPARRSRRRVVIASSAVLAIAGALALWRWIEANRAGRQVVRFELATIAADDLMVPAISPDGSRVVYAATQPGSPRQLYVRPLDSLEATALPGTAFAYDPFFSPDGRAIGFFIDAFQLAKVPPAPVPPKDALMTLDLATSRLTKVCDLGRNLEFPIGATWGSDGRIYYGAGYAGLRVVPASGGAPASVTTPRPGEGYHGWPEMLPDGRHVMFAAWRSDDLDHARVDVVDLATGERQTIREGVVGPRYLATGHLTYIEKGGLFAVRFDPGTLRVSGAPVQVLGGVGSGGDGAPFYAASATGTLVYHPGAKLVGWNEMIWKSRGGEERLPAPPGFYTDVALSPDDRRLAVAPTYGGPQEIWVHEFARSTWTRPVTQGGFSVAPLWHPADPSRIIFTTARAGQPGLDLLSVPADGSAPPELLYASAYPKYAVSSAPAARLLAFVEMHPDTKADIWLLDLRGKPAARPFLQTPFVEGWPSLSPDGKWLAYSSNESGRSHVYVRPVSGEPGKWMISTEGGGRPRWSRDGRRIVYWTLKGLMEVEVSGGAAFTASTPQLVAEGPIDPHGVTPNFEVALDGQRSLVIRKAKDQPRYPLVVVQNWFAELERGVRP